jgi:uncharacterized membrane protein YkvA (DUF1232 family)
MDGRIMPQASSPARRRTQPAPKEKLPRTAIAAVVSESRSHAEAYLKDRKHLQGLIQQAIEQAEAIDKAGLRDVWADLLTMLRLLKAYASRRYKDAPQECLLPIISAVAYFASPLDLIPDFAPGAGYLDDVLIIRSAARQVKADLERFMEWETGITRE